MNSFEYLEELLHKELKPQEWLPETVFEFVSSVRSEERRVGKECL